MSVMTTAGVWPPGDRPLTVEDLSRLPDDGNRYELDDGVLVVSPAPANVHQLVLSRLHTTLDAACPAEFLVLSGPGVTLTPGQYRIPDQVVVRIEAFDVTAESITSPPELVIEVASPSTERYDRNRKQSVYAGFRIPSYWIVKPSLEQPALTVLELRAEGYRQVAQVTGEQPFRAIRPFPVDIVPARLVDGPWRG
jgi:Uma2 family endonuclease